MKKKIIELQVSRLIYRTDPFGLGCDPGLPFNSELSLTGSQIVVFCDTLLYVDFFFFNKKSAYRSILLSFLSTMSFFIAVSEGKLHKPRKQK